MLTSLARAYEAMGDASRVAPLMLADPSRLRTWAVLSSTTLAARSQTIVLAVTPGTPSHTDLVAIDHEGASIIDRRVLLSELEGAVPQRYGGIDYRVAQGWLVHVSTGSSFSEAAAHMQRIIGNPATEPLHRLMAELSTDPGFITRLGTL